MKPLIKLSFGALCFLFLAIGCESGGRVNDGDDDNDTADGNDTDGFDDDDNDNDNDFDDDDNDNDNDDNDVDSEVCEEKDIPIVQKQTRLMILEDISGSMIHDDQGNPLPPPTKWDQAKGAMTKVATEFEDEIEIGVDSFPNDGNCGVAAPVLSDTLPKNAANITTKLNGLSPGGNTPLYLAMKNFTNQAYAPIFTGLDAQSYLLIMTDGTDTCGTNGLGLVPATPQQLTQITTTLLVDAKVKSIVIGFGIGTSGVSPAQLNAIAAAGGTQFDKYIDVANQADLESALEEIISSLVSCVYQLTPPEDENVDMSKVNFYFITKDGNGNEVEELIGWDEGCKKGKGWQWLDFDKLTVEFCKEACDKLQTGDVIRIVAKFGCNPIPIE